MYTEQRKIVKLISIGGLMSVALFGCGQESAVTSAKSSTGASAAEAGSQRSGAPALGQSSLPGVEDLVFAGMASGSSDSFLPLSGPQDLFEKAAAVVTGQLVGHEVLKDPNLAAPGYSGPEGVMRLYVKVDRVVQARVPVREAPGREGSGVIAIDYDYWVGADAQNDHQMALEAAEDQGARFLLVLSVATVDGRTTTGAFTPWRDPLGVLLVDSGSLRPLSIDRSLVEREAIERGRTVSTTTPEPPVGHEGEPQSGFAADEGLLGPLFGLSIDEAVAQYGNPHAAQNIEPPGEMPVR